MRFLFAIQITVSYDTFMMHHLFNIVFVSASKYVRVVFIQNYVHRSGRTARASKEGLSVMLVSPEELRNYRKIIKTLNRGQYCMIEQSSKHLTEVSTVWFNHFTATWDN